ncbi:MAG TPA: hypothetical protein DD670_11525 [Planctomycetaceae bacterium]|nr:hypothetical protein [Planctomycetaceae bacterium]
MGATYISQGHDLYVTLRCSTESEVGESIFFSDDSLDGFTINFSYGNIWMLSSSNNNKSDLIRIHADDDASLGPATITITATSSMTNVVHTIDVELIVESMPAALPAPEFNCDPQPIDSDAIASWEHKMIADGSGGTWDRGGEYWGDATRIGSIGWEAGTWYYDGQRAFIQIADYTGDSSWYEEADRVEAMYRTAVIENGSVAGYKNFAEGLALAYEREDNDPEKTLDAQAIAILAGVGPYWVEVTDVYSIRECSYNVNSRIMAKRIGLSIDDVNLSRHVDSLLGMLDQWFRTGTMETSSGYFLQPYMVGLASEALINWYEYTIAQHALDSEFDVDTRVPHYLTIAGDWLMGKTGEQWNAWNPEYGCWNYKIWYTSGEVNVSNIDFVESHDYDRLLNQLITPLFGWLYKVHGETNGAAYRTFGDAAFTYGVSMDYSQGKEFSQNYRWSVDYVQWRLNNPWANDDAGPVISNISRDILTSQSVYVTWKTDEAAFGIVEYGLTTEYGSTANGVYLKTSHRQQLNELTPGTDYHHRIKTTDSSGNVSYSSDQVLVVPIPGDANLDGVVDARDMARLGAHWNISNATWEDGDFNQDGLVNARDAAILAANLGVILRAPAEAVRESIPFVGPLPYNTMPATRPSIAPVGRSREGENLLFAKSAVKMPSQDAIAVLDAAISQEYGPQSETTLLGRQRLVWTSTVSRRQSHPREVESPDGLSLWTE